jgi:hypothetical protein
LHIKPTRFLGNTQVFCLKAFSDRNVFIGDGIKISNAGFEYIRLNNQKLNRKQFDSGGVIGL